MLTLASTLSSWNQRIIHALQEVDTQLRSIDEQQNIDISLAMGDANSGTIAKDQMDIAQRPTMRIGRNRTLSTQMAAVGSMVSISRQTSLGRVSSLLQTNS